MNVFQQWGQTLGNSFLGIGGGVIDFLILQLLPAVIIFLVGSILAVLIGKLIAKGIELAKLDQLLKQTSLDEFLVKAGFKLNSGAFIGGLVKWFLIVWVFVAAIQIIGLSDVNVFLGQVIVPFLPQVFVAIFVLLIGAIVAEVLEKIVRGFAQAVEIKSANFLGTALKWIVWIFVIVIAIAQLGLTPDLLRVISIGFIGMLALAGGLAFGLGGKEAAGETLKKLKDRVSPKA